MAFDLSRDCASIVDCLPDDLPDQSVAETNELAQFLELAARALTDLQQGFPGLVNKSLGGLNRLYLFDQAKIINTLERDVVEHWLQQPESLELSAKQIAAMSSRWYNRPVTEDRIKRRFRDKRLTSRLQTLCYDHDNPTDLTGCRSLPDIQKRLRLRFRQTASKWTFRGEVTFYDNGTVTIDNQLTKQDKTTTGKDRIRGNGSAISVQSLRNVLIAYSS
jgi:hypothetical protein